jgi:hypothetical protein
MSSFYSWAAKSPLAIPVRILLLPIAAPLILLGALMTDSLADGTPQPKFRTDIWQYITGKDADQ